MKGFNGKLKSKNELERYTKEQLIDMYYDLCENSGEFMEIIFTASQEKFEELKMFYKCIKDGFEGEKE